MARRSTPDSRKASIAEAVVCALNNTYSLRRRTKLRAASIGSELKLLNVGSYDGVCPTNEW